MKIPILKNTATNYLLVFVRLLEGILISRWIIGRLGMAEYGLWTMLWSFFVYMLLLDFGCGISAQKYTSGGIYEKGPERFNRLLSNIFTFHCLMGALIALITVVCSFFLSPILHIEDPAALSYARTCFLLFGLGAAVLFPMGLFQEVLVGLQRIYLRNYVHLAQKSLELVCVLIILYNGGGLISLILLTLILGVGANVVMGFFVFRLLPMLRLRLEWDSSAWKETASFSGFVYFVMISKMILTKSNRLLISIFFGQVQVGLFQLSSKVGDLCFQMVSQYQENISPISGAFSRRGKHRMLGRIIFGSLVWNGSSALLIMAPAFVLVEPILMFLFKIDDPVVSRMSRLLLISMYVSLTVRDIPHRYFMMSEHHRFAAAVIGIEAFINIAGNIVLLFFFGIEAVIWNSLIVKTILAFTVVIPYLIRCLKLRWGALLLRVFLLPALAVVPAVFYCWLLRNSLTVSPFWLLFFCGAGCGPYYLFLTWHFTPKKFRQQLLSRFRFARRTAQ